MSAAIPTTPQVTAADRLGMTLFFSVVLHAVIILGVVFVQNDTTKPKDTPPLEIILTHETSELAPEDADYLAQANQEGSGNTQERVRPANPPPAPVAPELRGVHERVSPPQQSQPLQASVEQQVLAVETPAERVVTVQEDQPLPEAEQPSAAELVSRSREFARLSAELSQSLQAYTKRPRAHYVTSNSKSLRDAAYLAAWVSKVERIGNINYPEEAKHQHLSGNLVLDVALNADGTMHSIELRRSSGHKVLDDAAIRIVQLAAPYAAFTDEMRAEFDILHITRTWQFQSGDRFAAQ